MKCPKCGYEGAEGTFCESCGEQLAAAASATATAVAIAAVPDPVTRVVPLHCACGAGPDKIDTHNVCTICGEIITPPNPRDHLQIRLDARRGAVSDLGHKHWRNEDSVALVDESIGGEFATVAVVSDGVSSSESPDEASETACRTVAPALLEGLRGGASDLDALMRKAIFAAQDAVVALPYAGKKEPPEATLLIILVWRGQATIGWLGDSRAYGVRRQDGMVDMLTEDHSWVNDVVNAGELTLDEALEDRRAHAVTQSLGRLPSGETLEPSVKTVPLDGFSLLLGCTDGFWNYAHPRQDAPPQPLIDLMKAAPVGQEAVAIAQRCVDFANQHGGHDNITVAVLTVGKEAAHV
ncbi:MAG TPA: PP2C family protein-serine/threonine phosphatase [Candidatus Xenobia bacterium]|jgi:serine/threonine protein phosphatase PrpC